MKKSGGRVSGFLDVDGRRIVNGDGEEVLLLGWGLGNWLLCEGYMWLAHGIPRFDRPRRIEGIIEELTGKDYAEAFWKQFRARYIAESDIRLMAEMGYNSVRIPINARLFVMEGPGVRFAEEGFQCLDRVLDWCEQYGLYAFIDLHGAPGGQTGANIDDSIDDMCRLLMDEDQFEKGLCLWEEIARRYKDRWIVGGYDLLNEPVRPARFPGDKDLEQYVPKLAEFYEKCIARIRALGDRHIVTLESHHWSTETGFFTRVFDPRMVIHFHRYGCAPDMSAFHSWLELSERLNVPLWLGETGENTQEWFAAMMPLALSLNIGVNMWPWKKMNCLNSPCSITPPKDWQALLEYARGGVHPGYERARQILDEYLEHMRVENCQINDKLTASVFRRAGCAISGTDFDELPGLGASYWHGEEEAAPVPYRQNTGMLLHRRYPDREKRFPFDGEWAQYVLRLRAGEYACYSLHGVSACSGLSVACFAPEDAALEICQDGRILGVFDLAGTEDRQVLSGIPLQSAEACVLRLKVLWGTADIETLITEAEK